MGTLLVGHLNVHHHGWLKYSRETSARGKKLRLAASDLGLQQIVKATRKKYLLDLALTNVEGAKAEVLPKIADHAIVQISLKWAIPETATVEREAWQLRSADWVKLYADLSQFDWSFVERVHPNEEAARVTDAMLQFAKQSIQKKMLKENKSTHAWLNEAVLQAVDDKRNAATTSVEAELSKKCSATILNEFRDWGLGVQVELNKMGRGSKSWWARERQLQMHKQKQCSIPALKDKDGSWRLDAAGKAQLLADIFSGECALPE